MIVAGGFYLERCIVPRVEALYGSAGRAAIALAPFVDIELHTFFPDRHKDDVLCNVAHYGISAKTYDSSDVIEFCYSFPLSPPKIAPIPLPKAKAVEIEGTNVLRFGCLEGEMIVHASKAVYDPQSGGSPRPFTENGSSADSLAMVLNEGELMRLSGATDIETAVLSIPDEPEVIVVKRGAFGAEIFEKGKKIGRVSAYQTNGVYKIGSGDVFSAMFSLAWMIRGRSPVDAADFASQKVAEYVETRQLVFDESPSDRQPLLPQPPSGKVYLAGSFFSVEHVWLVDEVRAAILGLGVGCFSPMHDVGLSEDDSVAEADLAGMEECSVVLALVSDMDPGTLFEIGYAHSAGKAIIAVAENAGPQDLTMLTGSGCKVFSDLATAIYHAAWATMN